MERQNRSGIKFTRYERYSKGKVANHLYFKFSDDERRKVRKYEVRIKRSYFFANILPLSPRRRRLSCRIRTSALYFSLLYLSLKYFKCKNVAINKQWRKKCCVYCEMEYTHSDYYPLKDTDNDFIKWRTSRTAILIGTKIHSMKKIFDIYQNWIQFSAPP